MLIQKTADQVDGETEPQPSWQTQSAFTWEAGRCSLVVSHKEDRKRQIRTEQKLSTYQTDRVLVWITLRTSRQMALGHGAQLEI